MSQEPAPAADPLDSLGCDALTRGRLETLVEEWPAATAIVVSGVDPQLSSAAVAVAAQSWLGRSGRTDLRLVRPEKAWTLPELTSQVLQPLRVRPVRRHVVILTSADRLGASCSIRLLRVLEEPPSPVTVFLVVGTRSDLPAPLRGRAALEIVVRPTDAEVRQRPAALDELRRLARRAPSAASREEARELVRGWRRGALEEILHARTRPAHERAWELLRALDVADEALSRNAAPALALAPAALAATG